MAWDPIVHENVWKELPASEHRPVREAMRAVAGLDAPARSQHVSPLVGSRYPKSYRLRCGRCRVAFLLLPDVGVVVFTTAMVKKRQADYATLLRRHDGRVRAYE